MLGLLVCGPFLWTAAGAAPMRDCNTELTPEIKEAFRLQALQGRPIERAPAGVTQCVPLAVHIVRKSDGTGGIAQSQLDQGLIDVNAVYNPDGINFYYLADIDYIDSDDYYFNIDTGAEVTALKGVNPVANAINLYFTPNVSDEDGGLCGSSSFTTSPGLGIVMNNGCTGTSDNFSSYPHEIGHYLDLFHTHSGGDELVDGTNCATAGDGICDTPADPNLTDVVTDVPGCTYTGTETDANGDDYVPDTHQLMSYSVKNCRDALSPQSRAKALLTLTTLRADHLRCPPVADAGPDQTVECTGSSTTAVQLDGTGSMDPDSSIETYAWSATGVTFDDPSSATPTGDFPGGTTVVTLTVRSDGAEDTDTVEITVEDTTDPEITCPDDVTVECTSHDGTPRTDPQLTAFFDGVSAIDLCDPDLVITDDAPNFFEGGTTTVTFEACDDDNNCITCTADVTVEDTTPPVITVELSRDALWPPNHKLSEVGATIEVTDICDPNPTFVLTSITSNEPDNGLGDGDTADDIQGASIGTDDTGFSLRSERAGVGDGRKYTIIYTASDEDGNTAPDTVCVRVPHDRHGGALSATGFNSEGTGFETLAQLYRIVVLSKNDFDASSIDAKYAMVGNHIGAVRPIAYRVRDANHDERNDLELMYSAPATLDLRSQSTKKDPLGLHYRTADGMDYLVTDIFKLGAPIVIVEEGQGGHESDTMVEEVDRGGTGEDDDDNWLSPTSVNVEVSGRVSVELFTVTGRKVRTLADQDMAAGRYELAWNGRDDSGTRMPSGIYFYRVSAPGLHDVRKIHLAR
jgi:hypothetical protein